MIQLGIKMLQHLEKRFVRKRTCLVQDFAASIWHAFMLISEAVLAAGVLPQINTHISSMEPSNVIDGPASLHGGVGGATHSTCSQVLASNAE